MRLPALAAALSLACSPAEAMDYAYHVDKGRLVINASGDIDNEDGYRFFNFIATLPMNLFHMIDVADGESVVVVLDSLGGRLKPAFRIAGLVGGYRLTTSVAPGGKCASACVVIWAAGARKSAPNDARLAVHSATPDGTAKDPAAEARISVEMTGLMAQLFRETGAPENVVNKTLTTPSNKLYWLTAQDLAAWETTR